MQSRFSGSRAALLCVPHRLAATCLLILAGSLATTALTAAPALALPEGRVYEMVSPVFKGGFGATHIEAVAQNGDGVAFYSPGVFAGAPSGFSDLDSFAYLARRGVSGWSTAPVMPPSVLMPTVVDRDVSATLDSTLALGKPGPSHEAAGGGLIVQLLLHPTATPDLAANWELAGLDLQALAPEPLTLKYLGGSADFCHLLVESTSDRGGQTALLPKAQGTTAQIYEVVRGCHGEPAELRLVALDGKGNVIFPKCSGRSIGSAQSAFNAVAAQGSEIFFTTCIDESQADHQLFVRLAGVQTLEVSKPLAEACGEVPCAGAINRAAADFVGASEDGSRVFFTTTAPLTAEDEDTGNDLYMASIGCPEGEPECEPAEMVVTALAQVSHDPSAGKPAGCRASSGLRPTESVCTSSRAVTC